MANPDLLKPLTKSKRQELATLTRFGTSLFASQCYPEAGLFACVRNGGVHRNMLICHHSTLGGYSIWCHAQVRTWGEGALLREACTTAEKCNCQAHWLLDASSMSVQLCFSFTCLSSYFWIVEGEAEATDREVWLWQIQKTSRVAQSLIFWLGLHGLCYSGNVIVHIRTGQKHFVHFVT